MQFRAKDIAQLIGGEIIGNENNVVSRFSKIEEAQADSICFFSNEKYAKYLENTQASILLVSKDFSYKIPETTTLIKVKNAYEATAKLLHFYQSNVHKTGVEEPSYIDKNALIGDEIYLGAFSYISEGAQIGDGAKIYPNVFIGKNVKIGENTIIYSGVNIYHECEIGNNCIIHSGVVIGSDGFGFAPTLDGSFSKIPQVGNVVVEDFVEIGANTVIDRATMGSTRIQKGTKLDNLIQIAHNVSIGQNTVVAAQAGISGSTKIGNQVMIGGQAGIVGHIEIADGSKINAQSGVSKALKEKGSAVTGSPAWDYSKMLKAQALIKKLPELFERILDLEKKVK
jgi:UDP-3-O-[3-hydroxymyristoyl] glucosamine N-acyltransferase